jgi:NitT/TauT family transport system substrate-binding protein
VYVADGIDAFSKYGLDVDIVLFNSGADEIQAVASGGVDIGIGSTADLFNLAIAGMDIPAFASISDALMYTLVSSPDIKDIKDLKGKSVAISKTGSLSDTIVSMMMGVNGLPTDYAVKQQAGGTAERWAALQSGAVDAALLVLPFDIIAQEQGFNAIADGAKLFPDYPFEIAYAQRTFLDSHPVAMANFMRGYIDAVKYFKDPANRDSTLDLLNKTMGIDHDEIELGYDNTLDAFPDDGRLTLDGLKLAQDEVVKYGAVDGLDKVDVSKLFYPGVSDSLEG